MTAVHREFGGCTHRCAGKPKRRGIRLSKPEKKGMCLIGNSRGIAVQVRRLLSGSGKALDTFLCPLHESGLVEGERM